MKTIVASDFDGTLTTKDTLLEFIRFAKGDVRCLLGFILHLPWLILMKLKLYPNWKSKQRVFSFFFKGMTLEEFERLGREFADKVDTFRRDNIINKVEQLRSDGAVVYVVSASIEEWVRPWCERQGYKVLGTKIETDEHGIITGRFSSKNCYGSEKVRRLMEVEPDRKNYKLYAFGDSSGDDALLALADVGEKIK